MNWLSLFAFDSGSHGGSMGGMDHGNEGWISMWWMWLIPILFISTIIFILYLSIRRTGSNSGSLAKDRSLDAIAILEQRFAKGEISTDEYRDKLTILQGK